MKRNLQLDVVRGIAILLVLGAHLQIPHPEHGPVSVIARGWLYYGGFGVPLFFVLSGFLIGGLLLDELRRTGGIDIKRFLIRRGFKIYPLYYLFLLYLIGFPVLKSLISGGDAGLVLQQRLREALPSLVFLQNYIGFPIAGHTWSLAVEEHFYFLLPFFIALLGLRRCAKHLWCLLIAAPLAFTALRAASAYLGDPYIVNEARVMAATHLRLDSLLLGVGIRAVCTFYPAHFDLLRPARVLLIAMGALCVFIPVRVSVFGVGFARVFPMDALAACLIFLGFYYLRSADFRVLSRSARFAGKTLALIGVYSFSIYVWHVTVIRILEREVIGRFPFDTATPIGWIFAVLLLCAGAVIVGACISIVVEQPVLRLRERLFPAGKKVASLEPPLGAAGSAPACADYAKSTVSNANFGLGGR